MECDKALKLMPDYEWLDESDRKELCRHASTCRSCEEKLRAVEVLGKIISEGEGTMKNPDFTVNIMAEIREDRNKPRSIFSFVAALVVIETAILIMLDPKFRETVNLMFSAVGLSDEYIEIIGDFFSSSIPFSYDLSLTGFLNVEMVIITVLAGIVLFFPAIRIFDERKIKK